MTVCGKGALGTIDSKNFKPPQIAICSQLGEPRDGALFTLHLLSCEHLAYDAARDGALLPLRLLRCEHLAHYAPRDGALLSLRLLGCQHLTHDAPRDGALLSFHLLRCEYFALRLRATVGFCGSRSLSSRVSKMIFVNESLEKFPL